MICFDIKFVIPSVFREWLNKHQVIKKIVDWGGAP